ncbi:thioredoxin family protein [Nonlabens agnitus]|uniref:Thioredoxin family protein n=1 Tax=Nonlabens agnitus TaxID=870484 RepID=A0A2S9WVX6_9FLAO|nr:thioredoxin family protein [Nonlabens agnitus]PRP67614.1 thioredoxin family protein [Nonlabens agnitus]
MELEQIIEKSLQNTLSYQQYRAFVEAHVVNGTNSGAEVTPALTEYTKLNHQRMKRLDKTMKLEPEIQDFLNRFDKKISFLIITESWCGDAAQTMPMINKVGMAAGIDLKIVLRDENLELMDHFLTNGSRSIAKLLVLDASHTKVLSQWGPRPSKATILVAQEKALKGELSAEFKQELQNWYNEDKGKNTENDLMQLLEAL